MNFTKSKIISSIASVIVFLIFQGCQKSPINGDLDGQWQIMSVQPQPQEIVDDTRMYYCFSLHTCQLTMYESGTWASGNMNFKDDILTLDFPDAMSEMSVKRLKQCGIYSNPVKFSVEHLDKKNLILRDGDVIVTLRKF